MTDNDRWLLPEGIEELIPPQADLLERLRRRLLDCYRSWGYELVMPPFIEFLESLLTGTGKDLDLQTFKVTDPITGRLMGVRADMTPQAARIDAHRLAREVPVRLCYLGTVLRSRAEGFAASRTPLQVGAELYGHAGIESDLEILELMLETLRITGVSGVHVDLGHVGIFRGLARQAGLDADCEGALFDALQRKAIPEIRQLVREQPMSDALRAVFIALAELNGGDEVLEEAGRLLAPAGNQVHQALRDLEGFARLLRRSQPGLPLHFDLAELRGYNYQTGMVFAAFVPGHGQEIARGGRYDDIGRIFGRARPATGFSADLKTLVRIADQPPADGLPAPIFAPYGEHPGLVAKVSELREAGERVIRGLPGQAGDAMAMGCERMLEEQNGTWMVVAIGDGK